MAPTLPVTEPQPPPQPGRDGGLGRGAAAMPPRPRGGPAAPAASLLLSARQYPGIKRNRGTVLKEQVKRKFKAPLLIITV